MIRPGPMRRRRFLARRERALRFGTWLDRLQVGVTLLLLLSTAGLWAAYCSYQHLLREEAAMQRMQQRAPVEQAHEEI